MLDRQLQRLVHRADGLGREGRHGFVHDAFDERQGLFGVADDVPRLDANAFERDRGGPLAVLGSVAPPRHAGRVGIDQKEADAVPIPPGSGASCRYQDHVGAVAVKDDALFPVDHERVSVAARRARDVVQVVAGLTLGMGEGKEAFARPIRGRCSAFCSSLPP